MILLHIGAPVDGHKEAVIAQRVYIIKHVQHIMYQLTVTSILQNVLLTLNISVIIIELIITQQNLVAVMEHVTLVVYQAVLLTILQIILDVALHRYHVLDTIATVQQFRVVPPLEPVG
jgi:hypothetical protein